MAPGLAGTNQTRRGGLGGAKTFGDAALATVRPRARGDIVTNGVRETARAEGAFDVDVIAVCSDLSAPSSWQQHAIRLEKRGPEVDSWQDAIDIEALPALSTEPHPHSAAMATAWTPKAIKT